MVDFAPVPGAPYQYDYNEIFRRIAMGEIAADQAVPTYRELCKRDLFFLLYFGLKRTDINHPWIVARIREVEARHDDTLDLWAREHYKGVCNKTKVLTPFGWTTHGALKPDDWVFSPSGRPVKVLAVTGDLHDPNMYRVRVRNGQRSVYEVLHATSDHLWDVEYFDRRRVDGNRRLGWVQERLSTRDMILRTRAQQKTQNPRWYRIKPTAPLHFPEKPLPVSPYVLGAWLGDGSCGTGNVTNQDGQLWDRIRLEGYDVSRDKVPNRDDTQTRTVKNLWPALKKLGYKDCKSADKFIPAGYLTASLEQRAALMQGLMDSDGSVMRRGTLVYSTTSQRLAEDVAALARTFGVMTKAREYWSLYNDAPYQSYRVTFAPRPDVDFFSLDYHRERLRKFGRSEHTNYWYITDISPAETVPAQCIQVEGGRYLAGDNLIPTHNSTILTYALPIQELLNNPEERICIFSHTRPIAKGFLRQIKQTLESDPPVKGWFADIFWKTPKSEAPKWSEDDGLIVRRKTTAKEASIEAWGLVDGQPISKHYTIRVYDDVVTRDSVNSPDMIQKTLDAYELSQSLGTIEGTKRVVGTHYHFSDLYMTLRKSGNYLVRVYPATHDGTRHGHPVMLTAKRLDRLRRDQGEYIFSSQQLLNPVAEGNQGFKLEWIRHYRELPAVMNRYLLVDPANEKKESSDYTVMAVIGVDAAENHYLLDLLRDKLNLTERKTALFDMWRRWPGILRTGYEKYGMQSDIQYMEEEQRREGTYFAITALGGRTSKGDRIRSLVPLFEQGRFYLPRHQYRAGRDLVAEFIEDEYVPFPYGAHDDMLDCISRIRDADMAVHAPAAFDGANYQRLRQEMIRANTVDGV